MKILIADDDHSTRNLIKVTLANRGYESIVVKDGDEAWQVFQSDDVPKLAILDWMMPGLDGLELCKKVRGRSQGRRASEVQNRSLL